MVLRDRRDGLLREAEHIQKRLAKIYEEVTALNQHIMPTWPVDKS